MKILRYYVHMALVASERATGLLLVTPSGLISCHGDAKVYTRVQKCDFLSPGH